MRGSEMHEGSGVAATPPGSQATPEAPVCAGSSPSVSIPNAPWRFDPADYAPGATLYIAQGGWSPSVAEYIVKRVTPSGQVVAHMRSNEASEIRLNKIGRPVGDGQFGRQHVVGPDEAREIGREAAERRAWNDIAVAGEAIDRAARRRSERELAEAMKALAQATEARRAATAKTGAVEDESAVPEGCAQGEQP